MKPSEVIATLIGVLLALALLGGICYGIYWVIFVWTVTPPPPLEMSMTCVYEKNMVIEKKGGITTWKNKHGDFQIDDALDGCYYLFYPSEGPWQAYWITEYPEGLKRYEPKPH